MKNNQKGFSVVEIFIVIVVIGLIGAVGWLVYSRQKSKSNNKEMTTQTNNSATKGSDIHINKQESLITLINDNGISVATTSLPTGWKIEKGCGDKSMFILTPEKLRVKCGTEDSGGYISLTILAANNIDVFKNCEQLEAKRTEYKQYDWYVSYDCELITVGDKQAVKETRVQNEKSPFGGANMYIVYTFNLSGKTAVSVQFANYNDDGKPEYTNIFNNFVNSLRFQSL